MSQSAMTAPSVADRLVAVSTDAAVRAGEADLELAGDCVLDWLGVVLAARQESIAGALRNYVGTLPPGGRGVELASWCQVAPGDAALVNGTLAHALDYDDVMAELPGHCGAPVVAAALAAAQTIDAGWDTVLRGVIAGVEVMCVLGDEIGGRQSELGWHPTAILGGLGAAAAASSVLGSSAEDTALSLAAAAVGSAGIQGAYGSHGKSWQVGLAAQRGVHAAMASRAGLRVSIDVLDTLHGFGDMYAPGVPLRLVRPGRRPLRIHDTVFKGYAACFATHSAIRAADNLGLRGTTLGPARTVTVEIGPQFLDIVTRGVATGLELKFDVAGTVAMVVLDRDLADPSAFSDREAASPHLHCTMERVDVVCNPQFMNVEARVTVREQHRTRQAHEPPPGPIEDPETRRSVVYGKFRTNSSATLTSDEIEQLIGAVSRTHDKTSTSRVLRILHGRHQRPQIPRIGSSLIVEDTTPTATVQRRT